MFLYICESNIFVWSVKFMFSPELEKFLKAYQVSENEISTPEKKCIRFKNKGGILASVEVLIRK